MPTYTLTYFNVRGRGELIRLIFHAAGLKFVDKRVEGKDWPALKPKIPHGTLPALEVDNDGKIFGQSIAIARFAANEGGLAGKNSREKLRADEIVDTVVEFLGKYAKFAFEEKDEAKKAEMRKEFVEKTIPSFLENMKGLLVANGGNYFVGTSLTWADLAIFNTMDIIDGFDSGAVNKFKQLTELRERIKKLPNLSSYLNERPKTDF